MKPTQAQRTRAALSGGLLDLLRDVQKTLAAISGEAGNTRDDEWETEDGSLYYEARVELRAASNALGDAVEQLGLLTVSLQYTDEYARERAREEGGEE